jgi:hypothetical protein
MRKNVACAYRFINRSEISSQQHPAVLLKASGHCAMERYSRQPGKTQRPKQQRWLCGKGTNHSGREERVHVRHDREQKG